MSDDTNTTQQATSLNEPHDNEHPITQQATSPNESDNTARPLSQQATSPNESDNTARPLSQQATSLNETNDLPHSTPQSTSRSSAIMFSSPEDQTAFSPTTATYGQQFFSPNDRTSARAAGVGGRPSRHRSGRSQGSRDILTSPGSPISHIRRSSILANMKRLSDSFPQAASSPLASPEDSANEHQFDDDDDMILDGDGNEIQRLTDLTEDDMSKIDAAERVPHDVLDALAAEELPAYKRNQNADLVTATRNNTVAPSASNATHVPEDDYDSDTSMPDQFKKPNHSAESRVDQPHEEEVSYTPQELAALLQYYQSFADWTVLMDQCKYLPGGQADVTPIIVDGQLRFELKDMQSSLFPYQLHGLCSLMKSRLDNEWGFSGAILGDGMGLGKTVQTIACMISSMAVMGKDGKFLIVVPTPLTSQWMSELEKHAGDVLGFVALYSTDAWKLHKTRGARVRYLKQARVIVASYDAILKDYNPPDKPRKTRGEAAYLEAVRAWEDQLEAVGAVHEFKYDTIFHDEAETVRNHTKKKYRAMEKLKAIRRVLISGTILLDEAKEAYPHLRMMGVPNVTTAKAFRKDFMTTKDGALSPAQKILNECMIRRTPDFVLFDERIVKFPELVFDDKIVDVNPVEAKLVEAIWAVTEEKRKEVTKSRNDKAPKSTIKGLQTELLTSLQYGRMATSHFLLVAPHLVEWLDNKSIWKLLDTTANDRPDSSEEWKALKTSMLQYLIKLNSDWKERQTALQIWTAQPVEQRKPKEKPSLPIYKLEEWLKQGFPLLVSSKLRAAVKTVETLVNRFSAKDKKSLVFTVFIEQTKMLSRLLKERNIDYVVFTGKLHTSQKDEVLEAFAEQDQTRVMIISLMAGSVGHNLAQANNVVLLDLWWNEATEDQAIARSYRIGQKNVVTVQRIVAKSSFDGKMMLLQDKKSKGINQIIDKVEENVKSRWKALMQSMDGTVDLDDEHYEVPAVYQGDQNLTTEMDEDDHVSGDGGVDEDENELEFTGEGEIDPGRKSKQPEVKEEEASEDE